MSTLRPIKLERSVSPFSQPLLYESTGRRTSDYPPGPTRYVNLAPADYDTPYERNPNYTGLGYRTSGPVPQLPSERRPSRVAALGTQAANQLRRIKAAPAGDILSVKASYRPGLYLTLGLLGRAGYGIGPALIEHQLVDIAPPPGATPGPGAGGDWQGLPLGWSALVTGLGASLGLISALCFLTDALKIPGNKRRAYFYFSMHCLAICLISASRAIIDVTKTRLPRDHLLLAVLPAAFGLGVHWVTIPRSFATSEVVHGNFLPMKSLEQRQMLAEAVQFTAAIFIALWAASNGLAHIHPLEREGFLVAGSVAVILGFALPNTNWRRAHREQMKRQLASRERGGSAGSMERGHVRFAPVLQPHLESPLSEVPLMQFEQDMLHRPLSRDDFGFNEDPDYSLKRVTTN